MVLQEKLVNNTDSDRDRDRRTEARLRSNGVAYDPGIQLNLSFRCLKISQVEGQEQVGQISNGAVRSQRSPVPSASSRETHLLKENVG